jgi:predicted DNA-binding protein with PD1-like motif
MRISSSKGHLSGIVMIKVVPGSDVIEGIEEACRKFDIKAGAIISCIGSLQRASVMIAVPSNNKVGAGYSEPINLEGPLEIL